MRQATSSLAAIMLASMKMPRCCASAKSLRSLQSLPDFRGLLPRERGERIKEWKGKKRRRKEKRKRKESRGLLLRDRDGKGRKRRNKGREIRGEGRVKEGRSLPY